jgi:hypothetical protein
VPHVRVTDFVEAPAELPLGPLGRLLERMRFVRRRAARDKRRELASFGEFAERRTG